MSSPKTQSSDDTNRTNALSWWRKQHPEFKNATMSYGWHDWCVFANYRSKWQCVAKITDVLKEYAAAQDLGEQKQ